MNNLSGQTIGADNGAYINLKATNGTDDRRNVSGSRNGPRGDLLIKNLITLLLQRPSILSENAQNS